MLSAFVQHGHNYGYASCLTADSADCTFKVCKMLVRAERNVDAVHLVCNAVVEAVAKNEKVKASYCLVDCCLTFACAETGEANVNKVRITLVASERKRLLVLLVSLGSPVGEIPVNLLGKLFTTGKSNYAERAVGYSLKVVVKLGEFHSCTISFVI